ncbi:MAG: hypothetical protein FWG10_02555 [Eubacteriaceae bacterium]|nr:hypothetical protein [Eubacteriaceae bacterium]
MGAKVASLTVFPSKSEEINIGRINLVSGSGIVGDYHQGTEKQVSILDLGARKENSPGFCHKRYKENILVQELPFLEGGDLLAVGSSVLRIEAKPCFDECPLYSGSLTCSLRGRAFFANIEKSGIVEIGDDVLLEDS